MMVVCKKCKIEHDARDMNNGICIWCEQKERSEDVSNSLFFNFVSFAPNNIDKKHRYRNYNRK